MRKLNSLMLYLIIGMLIAFAIPNILAAPQCVSGSTYINIISPDSYNIGQNIGNVTIKLKTGSFDFSKTRITAILMDGTTEIGNKLTGGIVNAQGETTINFGYSSARSATLVIKIVVTDTGTGQTFQTTKSIRVLPTLDNRLTCDVQGYIGRSVSCSWKTYDKDTGNVISALPAITVKQGSSDLAYNTIGSTEITFVTEEVGSISVKVIVSKDGYNSDTDQIEVSIQDITTQITLNVDNKDFFTYSGQFTTGSHSLELVAKDSGIPSDASRIDAEITTPAGQKVPITFNKAGTGVFRAVFNLVDPGQTYSLDGDIVYPGIRDSVPFSYKLATSGTATEDLAGQTTTILISAIVGGVILVAFIILAIWLRKRK